MDHPLLMYVGCATLDFFMLHVTVIGELRLNGFKLGHRKKG